MGSDKQKSAKQRPSGKSASTSEARAARPAGHLQPALDLDAVNGTLEGQGPQAVITWAHATFGEALVASSSFGAHSAVMLHLLTLHAPSVRVILVDTGYLFEETYRFVELLRERLGFALHVAQPRMTAAHQEALYGKLWEQGDAGVARYLEVNKSEPMTRALSELGAHAWIAGIRRDQTAHRQGLRTVERQDGRYKVHPIIDWSLKDVEAYITRHRLPIHPLVAQGYRSIGDWHSTLPTAPDQDPRDGRILGQKRECGLHLDLDSRQNASLTSSGL